MVYSGNTDEAILAEKPVKSTFYALGTRQTSSNLGKGGSGVFGENFIEEIADVKYHTMYLNKKTWTDALAEWGDTPFPTLNPFINGVISPYGKFVDITNLNKIPYSEENIKGSYRYPLLESKGETFTPINTMKCLINPKNPYEDLGTNGEEAYKLKLETMAKDGIRNEGQITYTYATEIDVDFSTQAIAFRGSDKRSIFIPMYSLFIPTTNGEKRSANTLYYSIGSSIMLPSNYMHDVYISMSAMEAVINKIPGYLFKADHSFVQFLAFGYKSKDGTVYNQLTESEIPDDIKTFIGSSSSDTEPNYKVFTRIK